MEKRKKNSLSWILKSNKDLKREIDELIKDISNDKTMKRSTGTFMKYLDMITYL